MQPFTITSSIAKKDYTRFFLKRLYKPTFIIVTIVGVLMFLGGVLGLLQAIIKTGSLKSPILPVVIGSVAISLPFLAKWMFARNYDNTPRLQETIQYTFSEEQILCVGSDFTNTFTWNSILKMEEHNSLLLLFTGKVTTEILNKRALSPEQLQFIKNKIDR